MAISSRLVSLISLSSIAVLICSFHATPVAALSVDHAARALHHPAHDALAKRKRSTNSKRCKPRPAPSSATSAPASSSDAPASSSAPAASSPSPSSTAQQSSAAPAPSPANQGNSKHLAAWANGDQGLADWAGLFTTLYTWSPSCPNTAQSLGFTCCPMLWGFNQVDTWTSQVMGTNPSCVMGPNEPEIAGQSNISPQDGLNLWNNYVRPMKAKGAKLFSPATTSDPNGKKWMQEFFQLCGGTCDVDVLSLHFYDTTPEGMIRFLEDMHNTFSLPIAVTEFACQNFNGPDQCSMDQVWHFEATIKPYLENTDHIVMFAPFGLMQDMQGVNPDNQLMNPDFTPNGLGRAYYG